MNMYIKECGCAFILVMVTSISWYYNGSAIEDVVQVDTNISARLADTETCDYSNAYSSTANPQQDWSNSSSVLVTVKRQGRLGNNLNSFAMLLGAANKSGLRPVLHPAFSQLYSIFQITVTLLEIPHWSELFPVVIEQDLLHTCSLFWQKRRRNVLMSGHFRWHSCYNHVQDELRRQLQLNKATQTYVRKVKKRILKVTSLTNHVIVGIHIRLSDKMKQRFKVFKYGGSLPPVQFFHNAMAYFENKYENVSFIGFSEDKVWLEYLLIGNTHRTNVFMSEEESGTLDFALLSSCDHVVITRGSFSWWAGWLVRGETVYYDGFLHADINGSHIESLEKYLPVPGCFNKWLPIGG